MSRQSHLQATGHLRGIEKSHRSVVWTLVDMTTRKMRRLRVAAILTGLILFTSPLAAQDLSANLLWEIGGIDGPEEVMWNRVVKGEIIGDQIYVLARFPAIVGQFTLDGEHVSDLGREGKGPGEFIAPAAVRSEGDSVGLYDFMQRRWLYFDAQGRHLSTHAWRVHPRIGRPVRTFLGVVGGYFLALTTWLTNDSVHYPPLLIGWTDPEVVDTLASIPTGLLMARPRGSSGQWNSRPMGVGAGGGVAQVSDSIILLLDGMSARATFYRHTPQGLSVIRTHSLPGEARALTDAEKEEVVHRYNQRWDHDQDEREYRVPDSVAAWSGVEVSESGVVWLKRGATGGLFGGREVWVRWSPQAETFRRMALPEDVRVLDIDRGLVLALRRGEFNEPYLQLYRIGDAD